MCCNFWLAVGHCECCIIEYPNFIVVLKRVLVLAGSFKFFVDYLDLLETGFEALLELFLSSLTLALI